MKDFLEKAIKYALLALVQKIPLDSLNSTNLMPK